MSTSPVRVFVADDHPVVRQGVRMMVLAEDDLEFAGEACSGEEAIAAIARARPDVVVLDLLMPGMGGVAAIPRIAEAHPGARILIFTSFTEDEQVVAALQAGALGCMIKDAPADELLAAIRGVARGESPLHPLVAQRLVRRIVQPQQDPLAALTPREQDVLRLIARGHSNQQIADELLISSRTVHTHIRNILDKLQFDNRTQAALYARDHGLA